MRGFKPALVLPAVSLFAMCCSALQTPSPERLVSMPLDSIRLDEFRRYVEDVRTKRGLPSCQYAMALNGEVLVSETVGDAPNDARYRIYSATKIVLVAVIWQLIGQGKLDPALPVTTWWTEFGQHGKHRITLENVLGHSAGVPNGEVSIDAFTDRKRRVAEIIEWRLEWEPGTKFEYHGLSAHWILAELITRITGTDFREAVRQRLLNPLGLTRLELGVPIEHQSNVLPIITTGEPATLDELSGRFAPSVVETISPFLPNMALHPKDDPLRGQLLTSAALAAGVPGACAVSDAETLALLYQALLHNSHSLWDQVTLNYVTSTVVNRHPAVLGYPVMRGLGTQISGDGDPDDRRQRLGSGFTSTLAFGHAGSAGQIAWADPVTGLSFVFLTNGWDRNIVELLNREESLNALANRCLTGSLTT